MSKRTNLAALSSSTDLILSNRLLDLYEATFDTSYLKQALTLQQTLDDHFWDHEGPGGYLISASHTDGNILGRQRGDQDGAEPTSSGVAAHNLLRLSWLFSDLDERLGIDAKERIAKCITSSSLLLQRAPHAIGTRVTAILHARLGPVQVVVVGPREAKETKALLSAIRRRFLPRRALILVDTTEGAKGAELALGEELVQGNEAVKSTLAGLKEGSYATICSDFTCGLPITDPKELESQLIK